MKHKLALIVISAVLLGAVLLGLGWFLLADNAREQSAAQTLEPFHNISLSVMSGSVSVEPGDSFSISYRLHGREKVTQLEVRNDTLYFDTGFNLGWTPGGGDWQVVITVPEGTVFDSVRLHSTAGSIRFGGYPFRSGSFQTTSGDIFLSDITCDSLRAKSVSHEIQLTAARITQSALLETVSGKISASGAFPSIDARSVGKIQLNGADQGRRLRLGQGQPLLTAQSVSGSIRINTN